MYVPHLCRMLSLGPDVSLVIFVMSEPDLCRRNKWRQLTLGIRSPLFILSLWRKKRIESYLVYCYPVPWAALISRCDSESDCSIWDFTPFLVHLQLHQRCIHLERELGKTAGCKNWQVTDMAWLLKIIHIPGREQFHLGTILFLPNYSDYSSSGELWRQLF